MIITIANEDYEVLYTENPQDVTNSLMQERPKFFTYDTETDSEKDAIHIKKDRPFLGAVCLNHKVFVFPTTPKFLEKLPKWASMVKRVYAHNTTFDMHMTANIVGDHIPLAIKNWGDTMGLARLAFEAVSTRDGGDSLALKQIAKKYIDRNADQYEKEVKKWLKAKETQNRKVLSALLKGVGWSIKRLNEATKNFEPIPDEVLEIYDSWRKSYPVPTYQDVPMDIMLPYLAVDVILTRILVLKALPVIVFRKQESIMEREFKLLPVVFKMERAGIEVDREYLMECRKKLEDYIDKLYTRLHELTGRMFSVNQHAVIKKIYTEILGEEPENTRKQFLKKLADKGDEVAKLITRLRRLEKWKETYIERILKVSEYDGRFYTQLNQFNPVSGRFSGDAQQFPKEAIYTEEGYKYEEETGKKPPEEYVLFHPRRAFKGHIYYLDYSQVELRVQAHYTLYFGGDLNLCRAYMPFKCIHYKTGEEFDYKTVEGRKRWNELREGAPTNLHWEDALAQKWSAWIIPETGETWVPTDVHSSTTIKALKIMGFDVENMDEKTFKFWRGKGKQFNFMRNYGGGDAMAAQTLEITLEQAKAMNRGYTEAFPLVVTYQDHVIKTMRERGYVVNMYGRRYYVSNWNKHYKCANYLIQGSCADMLKEKMLQIDELLTKHNCKTRMILCVHDELQFEAAEGEEWVIAEIKKIMEDTPNILVPIVAEAEMTKTYWSEKKKVLNIVA